MVEAVWIQRHGRSDLCANSWRKQCGMPSWLRSTGWRIYRLMVTSSIKYQGVPTSGGWFLLTSFSCYLLQNLMFFGSYCSLKI